MSYYANSVWFHVDPTKPEFREATALETTDRLESFGSTYHYTIMLTQVMPIHELLEALGEKDPQNITYFSIIAKLMLPDPEVEWIVTHAVDECFLVQFETDLEMNIRWKVRAYVDEINLAFWRKMHYNNDN